MEEVAQIGHMLNQTLSPDGDMVRTATEVLDRLSTLSSFPFALLSIATRGENQGQRVAAATYLKNFTRRNTEAPYTNSSVSKEFKAQLIRAILQVEPVILKVLLEALGAVVVAEFVKQNCWPELVPELRYAIENSSHMKNREACEYNTVNALMFLHAVLRPFQFFLNPKVSKEPVPPQLELIAKDVLVPLLVFFHRLVEKALGLHGRMDLETERILLIVCKCIYFSVRSHMPSALAPLLPSLSRSLFGILSSLSFERGVYGDKEYVLRLKTGKRSLLIFCGLVTRHRKYADKLMPGIINCALQIVKHTPNISKLDFLSERIVSLAFDVVSRVMETGPGWRLVSPHFSSLLESAIFPALVLNEKDVSDWEEDTDEYIRRNHPSEMEEISGWREDLFTARKSSLNLLGVISMSKGPPLATSTNGSSATSKRKKGERNQRKNQHFSMGELLVLPFLSKFPMPSESNASEGTISNEYFGVLMAFSGLQDFLRVQSSLYITKLVQSRVLPLYVMSKCPPYLVASANWVLGELASCMPKEMSADIYSSLLKALEMPDKEDISYYPVRVSAAGAIVGLLENDYQPPEWLPILQVVISRIGCQDEEDIILFELLSSIMEAGNESISVHIPYVVSSFVGVISKCMPSPSLYPQSQVVERGFEALAVMAQTWENSKPEEDEDTGHWVSGQATISDALIALLEQTWLTPMHQLDQEGEAFPLSSCMKHSSTLLRNIMLSVTTSASTVTLHLKLSELLLVWADLIANWNAWEESEDLSVFYCIKEVVALHGKYGLNLIFRQIPAPPASPLSEHSILESIGTFVSAAIRQYPSATWRACSCIHMLLHVLNYTPEKEGVKQSLVIAFTRASFSRFREIRDKPSPLWKPLLLAVSSCYLSFPDIVEGILEEEKGGLVIWASSLAYSCTHAFEPALSTVSEIKLAVMTLLNVVERLLGLEIPSGGLSRDCFISLMEASVKLKVIEEEMEDESDAGDEDDEDDEDSDDDDLNDDEVEESESDELEETEEEFLERYAKAAVDLENNTVIEEGDVEDEDHETELGFLEEVDQYNLVLSLIKRYHIVLVHGQALPSSIVSSFLNAFPDCSCYFGKSC